MHIILFILFAMLQVIVAAEEKTFTVVTHPKGTISLKEVIANSDYDGMVLLDQGYRGKFSYTKDSFLVDERGEKEFEFTHANLNDRGIFSDAQKAQTIVVGIDVGPKATSYRLPAVYLKKLPNIDTLEQITTINEFKEALGASRHTIPGGGGIGGVNVASTGWDCFTVLKDGSIRVVTVILIMEKHGEEWKIAKRSIGEGIFKPTGKAPQLEKEQPETEQDTEPNR